MDIWELKEKEKICILDLDDSLSDSESFWVHFANKILDTKFKNLDELKSQVPYKLYKDLKFEYRDCGIKRNILPKEGAQLLLEKLKELGFIIIILTRRPFYLHKSLFKITKEWLDNNKLCYDALIFEDKKQLKIFSDYENCKFILEDNRYLANILGKYGIKVYLINNYHNQGELSPNVIRINKLLDILQYEKQ